MRTCRGSDWRCGVSIPAVFFLWSHTITRVQSSANLHIAENLAAVRRKSCVVRVVSSGRHYRGIAHCVHVEELEYQLNELHNDEAAQHSKVHDHELVVAPLTQCELAGLGSASHHHDQDACWQGYASGLLFDRKRTQKKSTTTARKSKEYLATRESEKR